MVALGVGAGVLGVAVVTVGAVVSGALVVALGVGAVVAAAVGAAVGFSPQSYSVLRAVVCTNQLVS